jgi:hypothetical protein
MAYRKYLDEHKFYVNIFEIIFLSDFLIHFILDYKFVGETTKIVRDLPSIIERYAKG